MVTVKDVCSKITPPKKQITITDVGIKDGNFIDEEGNIADRLVDVLPDGEDTNFIIKITINMPIDEDVSE